MVHDSAVCGYYDLEPLFAGTGLKQWDKIEFRQPYIGIISSDGSISERLGKIDSWLLEEFEFTTHARVGSNQTAR